MFCGVLETREQQSGFMLHDKEILHCCFTVKYPAYIMMYRKHGFSCSLLKRYMEEVE